MANVTAGLGIHYKNGCRGNPLAGAAVVKC